jgi:hypothetical protein
MSKPTVPITILPDSVADLRASINTARKYAAQLLVQSHLSGQGVGEERRWCAEYILEALMQIEVDIDGAEHMSEWEAKQQATVAPTPH